MKRIFNLLILLGGLTLSSTIVYGVILSQNQSMEDTGGFVVETSAGGEFFDTVLALKRGIKGHVDISYLDEPPVFITVKPGESESYRIQYSFSPYTWSVDETIIVLETEDIMSYTPELFVLTPDEPVEVVMSFNNPLESERHFSIKSTDALGKGTLSEFLIKSESNFWYNRNELNWAYTFLECNMSVTPAWLMVSGSNPNDDNVFVEIEAFDFDKYPQMKKAFSEAERWANYVHTYSWVECSPAQGVDVVELFGGEIEYEYPGHYTYYAEFQYDDHYYWLYMMFSEIAPRID